MVLLSSMTSTLRPWSFELAPVTVTELLPPKAYGGLREWQAQRVLTYRPTPCYARHVTFLADRIGRSCLRAPGWDIRCSHETAPGCRDGPHRQHQVREGLDACDAAGGAGARLRAPVPRARRFVAARRSCAGKGAPARRACGRIGVVHARRSVARAARCARLSAHAQGSALRHGVHLRDVRPRACRAAGRAGGESTAGAAGHE